MNPTAKLSIRRALAHLRLLSLAEEMRFWYRGLRLSRSNRRFAEEQAPFRFPPARLLYEISGIVDYSTYLRGGRYAVSYLTKIAKPHLTKDSDLTVCEWGCGAARIIRHFPEIEDPRFSRVIGTDYDARMIAWCSANIEDVEFFRNDLAPPLPLPDHSVDFLYALSVFTHLTEELQHSWLDDLLRVVRPDGVVLMTTMGEGVKYALSPEERAAYENGELVTRQAPRVGSRLFSTYHSPAYMRRLLEKAVVLDYVAAERGDQDIWLIRGGDKR